MAEAIPGTSSVAKVGYRELISRRNPNAPLEVVDLYYELEPSWGIRADVLLAQMCLETGYLTSWWSQPPRRNMAGIGVTGESSPNNPGSSGWAFKPEDGKWYRGYSFPDWRSAVAAHFAHMVAYATADERNNAPQVDPRFKAARTYFATKGWKLPVAKVLTDLNGKWAVPGPDYGQKIEKVMQAAASLVPVVPVDPNPPVDPIPVEPAEPLPVLPIQLVDRTTNTSPAAYNGPRGSFVPQLLVLHDSIGDSSDPDRNDLPLDLSGFQTRENATVSRLQSGATPSIHYLIGPEALGAPVYRICQEDGVVAQVRGNTETPSHWLAPNGIEWNGQTNGLDIINYIAIGIMRWGAPGEEPGPSQTASLAALVVRLAHQYNLTPQRLVSIQEISAGQPGGTSLLERLRATIGKELSQ
jgi:hypothetical protein